MKKNKLQAAIMLLISVAIISCAKEEALTPNTSFTGEPGNTNINGSGDSGSDPGPTTSLVVMKRQRAAVTYVGATWCPPCGAYGDPTKEHIESAHGSDAVILNVQSGDAISQGSAFGPGFGQVFQSFVGSTGIPHVYWSGANYTMVDDGFSGNANSNNANADANINAIIGDDPDVGIAAKAILDGDSVRIETLTKFYSSATDSYIGVYLLEDGVEASQKISGSPDAITAHNNVMRASAYNGNDLGAKKLDGSSFAVDQQIVGNYTIAIPSTVIDQTKLQVAVVMWETNQADGISNAVLVDVQ